MRGGWRSFLAIRFALWRAGAKAVRITADRPRAIDSLDGLVAGGGDDISATLYGGELMPDVRIDPKRDALEMQLIRSAVSDRVPVLGICRGSQMINITFGGTLHVDIQTVFKDAPRLRTVLPRKTITVSQGSLLASVLGRDRCKVNALHHQSVKDLAPGLRISARDEFDIVQAIETDAGPPVLGVQWHPELMPFTPRQKRLFAWLVRQADERRALRDTARAAPAPA